MTGNGARDELLIRGALELWGMKPGSVPGSVTAAREETPLGAAWRVTGPDGLSRVHPSISGALRHLRSLLAPERRASRVLFMRHPADGVNPDSSDGGADPE